MLYCLLCLWVLIDWCRVGFGVDYFDVWFDWCALVCTLLFEFCRCEVCLIACDLVLDS